MSIIGSIISAATRRDFLIFVAILTVGLCVEAIIPRFRYDQTREPLWHRLRRNITVQFANRLLVLPIAIGPILAAASHLSIWHRPRWMHGIGFLIADLVILDFVSYAAHYARHKSKYMWRYHMVHHLDQHVDVSTGGRAHFVDEALDTFARTAVVLLLAVPLPSVLVWQTLLIFAGWYTHSNLGVGRRLERWINLVFVTRIFHDIHHGREMQYTDSNYGNVLTIWDYLFGTYSTMTRPEGFSTGLDDHGDYSATALLLNPMFRRGKPFRAVESQARPAEPAPALA